MALKRCTEPKQGIGGSCVPEGFPNKQICFVSHAWVFNIPRVLVSARTIPYVCAVTQIQFHSQLKEHYASGQVVYDFFIQ